MCDHIYVVRNKIKQTKDIKLYEILCIECENVQFLSVPFEIIEFKERYDHLCIKPLEMVDSDYIIRNI